MSALHTIGFKVGRLFERVITLAFSGLAGGIVGSILAGGGDGFVPGAIFGVFVGAAIAAIRAGRRAAAARAQTGRIGTLMAISSEAPPGAPWYHHTYVLIDEQGRRHKFRLTPEQAKTFSEQFAVGDVGRFTAAGNTLASFVPASPEAPVRPKTGIRVFISYAHELDREGQMAEYAAEVFAAAGLAPWVDRTAVKPGQKLREELVKQIAGADYFVPLLSPHYLASEWCLREFEAAADAGVAMRPIKIVEGQLVPPPYLKGVYESRAGDPVYLDLTSRHAPKKLREMAEEMAGAKR